MLNHPGASTGFASATPTAIERKKQKIWPALRPAVLALLWRESASHASYVIRVFTDQNGSGQTSAVLFSPFTPSTNCAPRACQTPSTATLLC
jgi:hypothetical protein